MAIKNNLFIKDLNLAYFAAEMHMVKYRICTSANNINNNQGRKDRTGDPHGGVIVNVKMEYFISAVRI